MVDPISGTFSQLLNTINRNRSGLQNSLERIASGRKLNRAGTDPAASALSAQLQSDISALTQSVKNVESGTNFVRTAEGGLAGIADLVNRGRELAIQSRNGTLNDSQRQTLNQKFGQIQSEIDRLTGFPSVQRSKPAGRVLGSKRRPCQYSGRDRVWAG